MVFRAAYADAPRFSVSSLCSSPVSECSSVFSTPLLIFCINVTVVFLLRVGMAHRAHASAAAAGAGEEEEFEEVREQDRFLPIANISRIMKKALPTNAKIAKDAKETVQESVSEFISFVTSEGVCVPFFLTGIVRMNKMCYLSRVVQRVTSARLRSGKRLTVMTCCGP